METSSKTVNIKRNTMYTLEGIGYSAMVTGIILAWIGLNLNGNGGWSVLVSSYSIILAALLFLGAIKINNNLSNNIAISTIIWNSLPLFLLLVTVIVVLIFLNKYKNVIQSDNLSSYYYTFSGLIILFITIEAIMLSMEYLSPQYKTMLKISSNVFMLLLLFSTINLGFLACYLIVLEYYTTQG